MTYHTSFVSLHVRAPAVCKPALINVRTDREVKAFDVIEHWLDLLVSECWLIMTQIFKPIQFIYIVTKHPDGQEFDLYRR